MIELRQSTARTVQVGPFLDSTDGDTEETGLTITQADVRLSKNGAAFGAKNEASAAIHDEKGWYRVPLDATDTGSQGELVVSVHEAGALVAWRTFGIVSQQFYDSKYETDKLQVDMRELGGVAQSATDLKDFADTGYDPATHKVEAAKVADSATALGAQAKLDVNAEADTALADYDPPTKAELDTAEDNIRGGDSDDLQSISVQLDTAQADLDNPDQYKADVSSLALEATLAAMKGDGWTDETLKAIMEAVEAIVSGDAPTVEEMEAYFAGLHGVGSWKTGTAIGLGAGLNPVSIALKNASGNPVTGIFFVVRNIAETTKLAIGITDGDGEAEIQLDDGTYKLRFGSGLSGAGMTTGYVYANPYTLTVSGTTSVVFTCTDAGVATAGITYAQLKGSLRLMLPQIPGVNWRFVTDPLIEQWLNSAYQEVDRKLRWTRCDHTFTTVEDQVEYVIPTVVREYIAVEMTDEDDNVYELKRIGLPEYIQRRASSTAAARPQCWVHHGDKFKLYPKPDSDKYSVTIHIVVEPPNLSVNEDQPGFPAHLHQLIIDQALVYAHRQFGDLDTAVALDAVTETKLKDERKEPALDRGGSGRVARPPV